MCGKEKEMFMEGEEGTNNVSMYAILSLSLC
jgi:hypothetical protein